MLRCGAERRQSVCARAKVHVCNISPDAVVAVWWLANRDARHHVVTAARRVRIFFSVVGEGELCNVCWMIKISDSERSGAFLCMRFLTHVAIIALGISRTVNENKCLLIMYMRFIMTTTSL